VGYTFSNKRKARRRRKTGFMKQETTPTLNYISMCGVDREPEVKKAM
jgi:hypothetical protein